MRKVINAIFLILVFVMVALLSYLAVKSRIAWQKFEDYESEMGISMAAIEGGTLRIASRDTHMNELAETIEVKDFYISKYEVTNGLFQQVMQEYYPDMDYSEQEKSLPYDEIIYPVTIASFCNRLSKMEGLEPCYYEPDKRFDNRSFAFDPQANGYRLPTEKEWEYAAKGGTQSKGFRYAGSDNLNLVSWYDENSGGRSHPAGSKIENESGLFDMSGNAFEACWNTCKNDVIHAKGGSWDARGDWCEPELDADINSLLRAGYTLGFRLARNRKGRHH